MSAEIATRQVVVTFRWRDDFPRFRERYATKSAEWRWLTATADLPIVPEDVRVTGRGAYLKADGSVGRQAAELRFGRLDDIPEPHRSEILAALKEATR